VLITKTSKSNLQKDIIKNYTTLINYSKEKDLGYYGTKLIHETILDSSNINLYTAIAISKMIDTKNENGIQFSQMPKGNMWYCKYNGLFGLRDEMLKKFLDYAKKSKYQTMALPFEKITDTTFHFDPQQKTAVTICYPIY
jgi:effector-binding domain-containing protein